jgi:Ca-activated chloride channel family protein
VEEKMMIHFIRPLWLLCLIPWVLIFFLRYKYKTNTSAWGRVCDEHLLPFLLGGSKLREFLVYEKMAAVFGILGIIAMSGPSLEQTKVETKILKNALVIVLDMSDTMNVEDVTPSRLERAKMKIQDILARGNFSYYALVAFTDEAYPITPTTTDADIIKNQLTILKSDVMPSLKNKNVAAALQKSEQMLKNAGFTQGNILLLSDGDDDDEAIEVARKAGQSNYVVNVLGMGTKLGGPIPSLEGGFKINRRGDVLVSKISERGLQKIAAAGDGRYHIFTNNDEDLNFLFGKVSQTLDYNSSQMTADFWRDLGWYIILPMLFIFPFMFIKNFIAVILLFVCFSNGAWAFELSDFYLNQNQQALRHYQSGKYAEAKNKFDIKAWRGASSYKNGDYEQAYEIFASDKSDVESLYNSGNALALQGKYKEAIAVYNEVLARNKKHADAEYNKKILEQIPPQSGGGGGEGENSESDSNNSSGDGGGGSDKSENEKSSGGQSQNGQGQSGQGGKDDKTSNQGGGDTGKPEDANKGGGQNPSENKRDNKGDGKGNDSQEKPQEKSSGGGKGSENEDNQDKSRGKLGSQNSQKGGKKGEDEKSEQSREEGKNGKDTKNKAGKNSEKDLNKLSEDDLAKKQMLDMVEDDPAGLLREKMRRIYMRKTNEDN